MEFLWISSGKWKKTSQENSLYIVHIYNFDCKFTENYWLKATVIYHKLLQSLTVHILYLIALEIRLSTVTLQLTCPFNSC